MQNETLNYNDIISNLREIARDGLRLCAVNRVRADILEVNNTIDATKKTLAEWEKSKAIANYEATKLDTLDPEYEDKKKSIAESVEAFDKMIARTNETIKNLEKMVVELNDKIAKIQSGETKMCADKLNAATCGLVEDYTRAKVAKLAN